MTVPIDIDGPAAPPRSNGELVFAEPWESRAFGMAVALYEADVFTWPQFQGALIARIAAWQSTAIEGSQWRYYDHWLGALEDVLGRLHCHGRQGHHGPRARVGSAPRRPRPFPLSTKERLTANAGYRQH